MLERKALMAVVCATVRLFVRLSESKTEGRSKQEIGRRKKAHDVGDP